MNIEELYYLCIWVKENIMKTQLQNKYQQLQTVLSQNAQQGRAQQPFESERTTLMEALENINMYSLSNSQIEMLEKLGIYDYIGTNGIRLVENDLYHNQLDIATLANKMNQYVSALNQGIEKVSNIEQSLAVIVEEIEYDEVATIRVKFSGAVGIENVADLKKYSAMWYDIGRGITMYHGGVPEDFKILGAEKGSIIIVLGVSAYIVKTVTDIIKRILEVHQKVIEIRIQKEELRSKQLQNNIIEAEFDKMIKDEQDKLLGDVIVYLETHKTQKSDGEYDSVIKKGIEKLIKFIDEGGEVDVTVTDPEILEEDKEMSSENKELIEVVKMIKSNTMQIKKIEEKIHLLDINK